MAPFRWPKVEQDVALLREVCSRRPSKPDDWDTISEILSVHFQDQAGSPVQLKGRGCREHMDLLIKKHKSEEHKALKRSGTEEELTEILVLLEDIASYRLDMESKAVYKSLSIKKKKDDDANKGIEMRKAAMETHAKRKLTVISGGDDSSDEENSEDKFAAGCSKKSSKRFGTSQMLQYLSSKNDKNVEIKERKLDLEEKKLALEEKRIALEMKKWDMFMARNSQTK